MKGLGVLLGVLLLLVVGCGSDSASNLTPEQLAGISKERAIAVFERDFTLSCKGNEAGLANALEALRSGELTAGKGYWELHAQPQPADEVLTGRVNSEGLASGFLMQFVATQTCRPVLRGG